MIERQQLEMEALKAQLNGVSELLWGLVAPENAVAGNVEAWVSPLNFSAIYDSEINAALADSGTAASTFTWATK